MISKSIHHKKNRYQKLADETFRLCAEDVETLETTWVELGGSDAHFKRIRNFGKAMPLVLLHGPIGFGIPHKSVCITTDPDSVSKSYLIERHNDDFAQYDELLVQYFAKWRKMNKCKNNERPLLFDYIRLWCAKAIRDDKYYPNFWDGDHNRFVLEQSRLTEYMFYLFCCDLGLAPIAPLEYMCDAIVKGYWPLGFYKNRPIVWKLVDETESKKRK